ncbi:hypothetical protein DUI87_32119 [Hirundo rustica rustica]|uniref:ribonuclease H n=1 Tax=Hirundo rustica rustica TaxID=333673 RepID=A0A3M0IUI0_HIRRU|nr:hypothetical protein DUI87_32119 [Hirundo rustica rustica]
MESWEAPREEGKLLQYVDDILIATRTKDACVAWTVSLRNFLGLQGYRVYKKKAQVMKQKVIYLGYEISEGEWILGQDRKEAICQTLRPQTVKELRTFLGMTGWCRPWILSYGLLVKPLYALITNGNRNLQWTKEATQAFHQLKNALIGNQGEPVHHDCLETIKAAYSSCLDLKDTSLDDAETWFTDRSGYIISGKQHDGYAVTTCREEILWLLEAIQLPEQVAIMHIKAQQSSKLEEGNDLVDREAKEAAKGEITIEGALIPDGQVSLEGLKTRKHNIKVWKLAKRTKEQAPGDECRKPFPWTEIKATAPLGSGPGSQTPLSRSLTLQGSQRNALDSNTEFGLPSRSYFIDPYEAFRNLLPSDSRKPFPVLHLGRRWATSPRAIAGQP